MSTGITHAEAVARLARAEAATEAVARAVGAYRAAERAQVPRTDWQALRDAIDSARRAEAAAWAAVPGPRP